MQLQCGDTIELHRIVLHLAHGVRRAEGVLLANDVAIARAVVSGPPEHELLCPGRLALLEYEANARKSLRGVKAKPQRLGSWAGGAPTAARFGAQRGVDRISIILGCDFNLGVA